MPLLLLQLSPDGASLLPFFSVHLQVCLVAQNRAGVLLYLIERAKKCRDFSATLYIIHLFICIVYGGWPSSITWWIVNVTGLAVMALLGEYLCIKRELREIRISRYRSTTNDVSWMNLENTNPSVLEFI
ncbi:uncharacterized protein LOC132040319 isoform X4 [Lycium ferocissimum]|uniref:uncharacterized protein LOC132040319 isoform X4 n=1 Tax=Lycium ferocissimum TaxID=112874 RepID=UPI002815805B|nr:uncharacterized protein LOC132040319 isoform X4 [Lycium ferocissimum]